MILFYLLVTVLPLTRHPVWSLFVGDLTVIKYLGLACVCYAMGEFVIRPRPLFLLQTWQARFSGALLAVAIVSYFTLTKAGPVETSPLMLVMSLVMLLFVTVMLVDSMRRLRTTVMSAIGGVAFASLYVLREFQKSGGMDRPGWVVGDPNYFTASALLCLPLAFWLMQEKRPSWMRVYCIACLVVTLLAVTVAASRGGFLGLVASVCFVLVRSRNRVRNFAILACLLVPMSLVSPLSPLVRLVNPTRSDTEAADIRYGLWAAGVRMFRDNPITGVGIGNFKPNALRYQAPDAGVVEGIAHNAYVEVAAELGGVGLLLFLAVLISTFVGLERVRKQAVWLRASLLYHAAIGIQAGLVGYAVAVVFVSGEYQRMLWFMVFLSIALAGLSREMGRKRIVREREAANRGQSRQPEHPVV
jgi:O-antigen ligase